MMAPPIEFILTIFSQKKLIADFYDVSGRRKIKLKCIKIRLLNRIMKKYLNKLHSVSDPYRMAVENQLSH